MNSLKQRAHAKSTSSYGESTTQFNGETPEKSLNNFAKKCDPGIAAEKTFSLLGGS
ncbi:MAG TPA: hypothetical protein VFK06_10050 [Candidatus Angelobacter sp.]|nr:hypothetical protein [Candidatus Angelobacter sp.]